MAAVPALLGWFVYVHFMHKAADEEIGHFAPQGSPFAFSDSLMSRWTLRGALFGMASITVGLLIGRMLIAPDSASGADLSTRIVGVLFMEVVFAFGGAAITRRQLRILEKSAGGYK
ncbi:MAG: hypothetical protein WBJ62_04725 [Coriobacteriia bacterium]